MRFTRREREALVDALARCLTEPGPDYEDRDAMRTAYDKLVYQKGAREEEWVAQPRLTGGMMGSVPHDGPRKTKPDTASTSILLTVEEAAAVLRLQVQLAAAMDARGHRALRAGAREEAHVYPAGRVARPDQTMAAVGLMQRAIVCYMTIHKTATRPCSRILDGSTRDERD